MTVGELELALRAVSNKDMPVFILSHCCSEDAVTAGVTYEGQPDSEFYISSQGAL